MRCTADGARHAFGCDSAIYLERPGASVRVRSWTPLEGPYHGFLITHGESISISDYFTLREMGRVVYRPTVHYAYHPCDDAVLSVHELGRKNWHVQPSQRLMMDEIISGIDELGVLLAGHANATIIGRTPSSVFDWREAPPTLLTEPSWSIWRAHGADWRKTLRRSAVLLSLSLWKPE